MFSKESLPYRGLSRKLVLAFDVGTTFSGISYCILDPGEVSKVQGVKKYPAQEHIGGDNKIPSVLYYDCEGVMRAAGAEALQPQTVWQAEQEAWVKVEWWKLHLRPRHLASSHIRDEDIPPLPEGKTALDILADFLWYLFACARGYITASGITMWESLENNIEFILTHPNGWEGPQQQQMRRAAEMAGLVPNGEEHASRIHLLTEGEASIHFCVINLLATNTLSNILIVRADDDKKHARVPEHQGIVIIDAGGGTIDLSAYSVKLSPPTEFQEVAPAECRLQGSVFVTQRAHAFFRAKLANSPYGSPEFVEQMKVIFDKRTKLRFHDPTAPHIITFGTARDKDPDNDIRSGQLKLAGEDVAEFFKPSVNAIADAFEKQRQAAAKLRIEVKHAFLVGGFAASDFLYSRLLGHPVFSGVNLCRPSTQVNKAVADGAVLSYNDPLVTSRTSRFTYGIKCDWDYDASDPEHREREHTQCINAAGDIVIPNGFASILKKEIQVSGQQEFRRSYSVTKESRSELNRVLVHILAYRGKLLDPRWVDEERARFTPMCAVIADTLDPRQAPDGNTYYLLKFDIALLFGLTELKAQICWRDNGVEKRGPASVVHCSDPANDEDEMDDSNDCRRERISRLGKHVSKHAA